MGIAAGFAAVVFALGGCGNDTGDLDAPDSPVARYDWDQQSAMEALGQGVLVLADGCLALAPSADEKPHSVPVFPRDLTSWDNEAQVLTYAGTEFRVGDHIVAGGGFVEPLTSDIPQACREQFSAPDDYFLIQDESIDPTENAAN